MLMNVNFIPKNLISRYNVHNNDCRWEYADARETGLTVSAKNSSINEIPGIIATMAATCASRNSRLWFNGRDRTGASCRVGVATYTRRAAEISAPITFYRERLLHKKYELLIEGKSNFMYST